MNTIIVILTSNDNDLPLFISCDFVKQLYINIFSNLTFSGDWHDSGFNKHGDGGFGNEFCDGDGSFGGDAVTWMINFEIILYKHGIHTMV